MAIVAPLQGHFDGGELSPLLYGRVDADRYKGALALCKNWIATLQGGLPRRPGTYYLDPVKDSTTKPRLIPFQFSTTQAYMLEFGAHYIRIWANYGQVQNGGTPVEISSPYDVSDLPLVRYTQSADVLYLAHPNYPPCKVLRFSNTTWQLQTISFIDGPYQTINSTQVTLTPAATSGTAVTVTAGPQQDIGNLVFSNGFATITINNHGWTNSFPLRVSGVTWTGSPAPAINGYWPASAVTIVDMNTIKLTSAFILAGPTWSSTGAILPAPFPQVASSYPIRIEQGSTWGWGIATSDVGSNYTSATVNVQNAFAATTATISWRLGSWYTGNYPGSLSFHEDRLCFSGTPSNPQRIDMSRTSNYEHFGPTQIDGSVNPDNACNFSLNSNDVNAMQWLSSDEKGLLCGGLSAEWIMRPSINLEAITPTNVSAKRSNKWGSAAVQGILVGKATLHIQRGARKLRELLYSFYIDGYQSTDLTELSEHITGTGVTQMAYSSIPYPIVWLLRNDGALIGVTYDRDIQQLRVGWHWHVLGGQSDSAGTPPIIESIAVISSPDGTKDDLWMIVNRWINGATVRTVEYMSKVFEDIDLQQNAFFFDCGLTLNNPISVTGVTQANPAVVTAPAHGFSTGNSVIFDSVVGMTQLNGNAYTITVIDANTFSLNSTDSTLYGAYVSSGQVRKRVTTVSGLSAFNGETFGVWADGVAQNPKVVTAGAITLDTPAAVVSVGYDYNSDGQQLRLEAGSRNGTSMGKTRRTHRVAAMVHRAQGLLMGPSFSQLDTFPMNDLGDTSTLFSGIRSHEFGADYDFDNPVCFRVNGGHPCTMLAIMPMLETQDRA